MQTSEPVRHPIRKNDAKKGYYLHPFSLNWVSIDSYLHDYALDCARFSRRPPPPLPPLNARQSMLIALKSRSNGAETMLNECRNVDLKTPYHYPNCISPPGPPDREAST
jgi:hypothetical protein